MTVDLLQKFASSLPHVTQDIKWEDHLCFNIGGKMFLVTAPSQMPVTASFKVTDENFIELAEKPGFIPAPYLARHKWIKVDDISRLNKKQWEQYISEAYQLVYQKLPAGVKKQLTE